MGKIDEDRKCLAKLYIKAYRHTSSAEIQAAAYLGRRGQKLKSFEKDTKWTTVERKIQQLGKR